MKKPGKVDPSKQVVASNRRARRDYDILDTWEAGIVLGGSEVKSLREATVQLADAYARLITGEMWLIGLHITPYSHAATQGGFLPDRDRKLLMNRKELNDIRHRLEQERLTLIPLMLYFKDGRCKLELGLGRGRREYDKRQVLAEREAERRVPPRHGARPQGHRLKFRSRPIRAEDRSAADLPRQR